MKEAILVDTSVWINFFKGIESPQVRTLTEYIQKDYPIYICPTIIQEILQGIGNDKQYRSIKDHLLAFNILNDDALAVALASVEIYRSLRKKGISIRKSNDCLIARYAFKYSLKILHQDRDFDMIQANYK
ncbi:PIN domain-containing protein [Fulvivirgaceae bacterium BMA12]|uniref:PIN domain-containing protein n=1 Tax=Agaribacillus aureus TaxID=3051825 RepID=A0ABT8KZR7_9BACT|nr:PIN domain-containing protein [Fulvivirgaceae bacterium BMA12]